jgi:hypothetical protein
MLFVSIDELEQHIGHNFNIHATVLNEIVKYEFAFSCDPENAEYCKKRGCQDFCHHTLDPKAAKNFDLISDQPTRKKYFEKEKSGWIPVKYRKMTDEEVKEYEEQIGEQIPEDERVCFDCSMPDDDQEILVCTNLERIYLDRCEIDPDYVYGLEENGDWDGVVAWMPLPKPYVKEGEQNE